jgi:tetratricopeptide (TPR) repeat protein
MIIGLSLAWIFAIAPQSLRILIALFLIVWALAGSLVVSWALVDLSGLSFKHGYYNLAALIARVSLKVDSIVQPLGALFGMEEAPFAAFNTMAAGNSEMLRGRFELAREFFKRALNQCDSLPGAGASLTPVVLSHLAQAEYCLADFDQADCTLRQSLNLKTNRLSREDLSESDIMALKMAIAADHHCLGSFLEKRLALGRAEEEMLKALDSIPHHDSSAGSQFDRDFAVGMRATFSGSLADLYLRTGRIAEAETLARRSLTWRQSCFRPGHPAMSASFETMAKLNLAQGNLAEARSYLKKAEKIRKQYCQENHSDLADTMKTAAALLSAEGKVSEAPQLLRQALLLKEKTYGKNHPDVAELLEALVDALKRVESEGADFQSDTELLKLTERAAAIRSRFAFLP